MKPRDLFNETVELAISRPAWQLRALAWVVLFAIGGAVYHRQITAAEHRGRDDAFFEEREHASAVLIARLHDDKLAIGKRIDRQTVTVTRTVHRLDTLWQQRPESLATRADTVKALDALPVLHRATDSAIAACSEFQISCAEYRRVADSLELALRIDRDQWKERFQSVKPPGRLAQAWRWVQLGAVGYVGYRVGKGR